jgi:hypothetical protein
LTVELKDRAKIRAGWAREGTLVEILDDMRTFNFQVVIDTSSDDGTFTGRIDATNPNDQSSMQRTISGMCDGVNIRFQDEEGRLFSGVVEGSQITGQVVWDCDGCIPSEFTISRRRVP